MGAKLKRAGREDFVDPRARERRRRRVARQHVPRRGLRRPQPRLLAELRAEPGLDAHVLAPARDPRLPAARRPRRGPPRPHPPSTPSSSTRSWDGRPLGRSRRRQGPLRARALVAAAGPLVEPKLPDVPGLVDFAGEVFHSARWDHDVDLTGKRVAVVGTGARAIQFIPEIADRVAHMTVFQRTAPWVLPRTERPITPRRARALQARPRRPGGRPQGRLLDARAGRRHAAVPPAQAERPRRRSASATSAARSRPRAAREGDAGLRARLQAPAALQHVLPGARAARMWTWSRPAWSRCAATRSSAPTARRPRST